MTREFAFITRESKGILGSLDEDGVVTFAIEAGELSSVRGTDMFNRMMEHFGKDVRAIHGMWIKGTNIDKVNELTAQGMPIAEAVRFAWTATRAAKLGFTRIRLFGNAIGTPGAYTKVDVWIEQDTMPVERG